MTDNGPRLEGRLTLDQLRDAVERGAIETVIVAFTDHYGRLMGKRYAADVFLEDTASHGTHGCNYLLTTDMEMEPVPGYSFASWEQGYGDFHLVPDLDTLIVASWLEQTALVLCDVASNPGRKRPAHQSAEPVPIAPRSILRHQVDAARELGYTAFGASELEYYVFQDSYRQAAEGEYRGLRPVGWYLEDYNILQGTRTETYTAAVRRHLKRSGVPVESSKGEWGLGQHELNVRYAEALQMADRHVVFKQCMKEVAEQAGLSVTFMAKFAPGSRRVELPHPSQPVAGWQERIRGRHERWTGGMLGRLPLVSGRLDRAGTGCDGVLRADDQFVQAIRGRLVGADAAGMELRQPHRRFSRRRGRPEPPDRMPYSRSGLQSVPRLCRVARVGARRRTNRIEPPECFTGDVYAARHLPRVAHTLRDATDAFAASEFARRAFGNEVVEHYSHFFRTEESSFRTAVTDWERRRYFERI